MMIAFVILGLVLLSLLILSLLALRRLFSASEVPVTVEWAKSFSLSAYAPMERLLDDSDFRFLKSQPGFNPKIAKELRAKRVRIFHAYLGMIARDFYRLHSTLQAYLLSLEVDDNQIATELLRQKWSFQRALVLAHIQLRLYSLGLGSVSAVPLLAAIGAMGQLAGDVPELLEATARRG